MVATIKELLTDIQEDNMPTFGYHGKVLHIDLSSQTSQIEQPDEKFWRICGGGGLLAANYLLKLTPPKIDAYDPENLLIFTSSVMAGLPYPGLARFTTAAKSPLTGGIGETRTEGPFGMAIKCAGVDAIIIRGKARGKTILKIESGKVHFLPGETYWGQLTTDVLIDLQESFGEDAHCAIIGPAGENLVRFASIVTDGCYQASRMGMGAVMGSKNLKALVLKGEQLPKVYNPEACQNLADCYLTRIHKNPLCQWQFEPPGFSCWVHTHGTDTALCTRNYSESVFELADEYQPEKFMAHYSGDAPCPGCPNNCIKRFSINMEDQQMVRAGGIHQEIAGTLGPNCGTREVSSIFAANVLCNQLGLDPTSLGFTISMAMEWQQKGIKTIHTEHGDLKFGNDQAMLEMIKMIAYRRQAGDLLAEGSLRAAQEIGGKAINYAMQVKGLEMVPFEPRSQTNLAMGYATAPIGPRYDICEHDWDYDTQYGWPHTMEGSRTLEILERIPMDYLGVEKVRNFKALSTIWSAADVLDLCIFAVAPTRLITLQEMGDYLGFITGWQTSAYEIMRFGERRIHLMRMYNIREGITADQDTLPERFFNDPLTSSGRLTGITIDKALFSDLIKLYYNMMGWDENGIPSQATLLDHHLEWVAL
jgi:aldehyde:ferredoxin oxidoreductase